MLGDMRLCGWYDMRLACSLEGQFRASKAAEGRVWGQGRLLDGPGSITCPILKGYGNGAWLVYFIDLILDVVRNPLNQNEIGGLEGPPYGMTR